MKIILLLCVLSVSLSNSVIAQWVGGIRPTCSNMATNCKKTAIANGFWDDPNIWNPVGAPTGSAADNVVCIPAGITVQVKNSPYQNTPLANRPTLYIFICGTLQFTSSGKLYLSTMSTVNILPSTGVLSGANASTIIEIGNCAVPTVCQWQGPSIINAPYYLSGTGQGAGVLAASLKKFNATLLNSSEVEINWTSLTEEHSLEYIVERSTDSKKWSSTITIPSRGNSNSEINYTTIDKSPASGINFYRLKEVDIKGNFQYSAVVKITNKTSERLIVFPNPAHHTANMYSSIAFNTNQSVQLFSMTGSLLKSIQLKAGNNIQLPVEDLKAGVYLIRLTENGVTISETKLVKR